jgi:aryl-alcohol dehydrogenase-like predicted oxidoreductase
VIGNWFEKAGRRDDVVLATKFRFTMGEGPNRSGASRYRIVKTVEDSLRRLKTDRIDLYQIHMQDIVTPEEETLRALDDLVRQGKVLYLGCSNYAAYRLTDSLWISKTQNLEKFVTLQAQYSLLVRDLEREHVPLCRAHGLGILPWSPLAGGFLTGKYQKGQEAPEGARLQQWKDRYQRFDNERNWRIIDALETVARELDKSCAQVALAWLLHKETVTSVIFGARTIEQLDDNLAAADIDLNAEQMARLDEASGFDIGYPYQFMGNIQNRW